MKILPSVIEFAAVKKVRVSAVYPEAGKWNKNRAMSLMT
jgi:hypothetical protein